MHNQERRRHGSSTYMLISILQHRTALPDHCAGYLSPSGDGDPNVHACVCLQEWSTQTLPVPPHASLPPLPAQLFMQHPHGPGGQTIKDKSAKKKKKSVLFLSRPVCFSVCSRQQKNPNTWCWHCWPMEERRGEGAEGDGSWVDGGAQHQEPFQPIVILFVSQCLYL